MKPLIIVLLILPFLSTQAQTNITNQVSSVKKKEFKNQGEQEDYWAEQFFEKKYSKQAFERYKGSICVNGYGFIFSDQTLVVTNTTKELRSIFSKGIFYPTLITGPFKSKLKNEEALDSLTVEQTILYNLSSTDSLRITDFEELKFLSKTPTEKRFRFWVFRKGFSNPTVWFIELSNHTATEKTDIDTFINGAILTFCKEGWIII